MRLSTRGRYGVRAMLDLALFGKAGPVNLKEIASRQQISIDYLEQLLRKLRQGGLVHSVRGPHGGFVLARSPEQIPVWDIVACLEQEIAPAFCVDAELLGRPAKKKCPRMSGCATHLLWLDLAVQTRKLLEARTLKDLADDARTICDRAVPGQPLMFDI